MPAKRKNTRDILDANPNICELYPLSKANEKHYQNSNEFISEPTDLFYLQIEVMDWTTFDAQEIRASIKTAWTGRYG